MAWKMPPLMVRIDRLKSPLSLEGTSRPSTSTVTTIMSMPMRARVLALASYHKQLARISNTRSSTRPCLTIIPLTLAISRYSVRG